MAIDPAAVRTAFESALPATEMATRVRTLMDEHRGSLSSVVRDKELSELVIRGLDKMMLRAEELDNPDLTECSKDAFYVIVGREADSPSATALLITAISLCACHFAEWLIVKKNLRCGLGDDGSLPRNYLTAEEWTEFATDERCAVATDGLIRAMPGLGPLAIEAAVSVNQPAIVERLIGSELVVVDQAVCDAVLSGGSFWHAFTERRTAAATVLAISKRARGAMTRVDSNGESAFDRMLRRCFANKCASVAPVGGDGFAPFFEGRSRCQYRGGVAGPGGYLYFAPFAATQVLRVNVETQMGETIGDLFSDDGERHGEQCDAKWASFVVGFDRDGRMRWIFGVPWDHTQVLRIDLSTNKVETIGPILKGSRKWADACAGPDGVIYCMPFNDSKVRLFVVVDTDSAFHDPPRLDRPIARY